MVAHVQVVLIRKSTRASHKIGYRVSRLVAPVTVQVRRFRLPQSDVDRVGSEVVGAVGRKMVHSMTRKILGLGCKGVEKARKASRQLLQEEEVVVEEEETCSQVDVVEGKRNHHQK